MHFEINSIDKSSLSNLNHFKINHLDLNLEIDFS